MITIKNGFWYNCITYNGKKVSFDRYSFHNLFSKIKEIFEHKSKAILYANDENEVLKTISQIKLENPTDTVVIEDECGEYSYSDVKQIIHCRFYDKKRYVFRKSYNIESVFGDIINKLHYNKANERTLEKIEEYLYNIDFEQVCERIGFDVAFQTNGAEIIIKTFTFFKTKDKVVNIMVKMIVKSYEECDYELSLEMGY